MAFFQCHSASIMQLIYDHDLPTALKSFEVTSEVSPEEQQQTEWCVMIYSSLEGGEPLETFFIQELVDMLDVSLEKFVHVVAQVDYRHCHNLQSKRYCLADGKLQVRAVLPNQNMGDPAVFADFLTWAMQYPAKHRLLFIQGHGTGVLTTSGPGSFEKSRSFGIDYGNNDSLSMSDASSCLQKVLGDKKIDVLAFRSCLMNGIECATMFSSFFDYMIATETTQKAGFSKPKQREDFFDTFFLDELKRRNGIMEPLEMATAVYESIRNTNMILVNGMPGAQFEISCWDLSRLRSTIPDFRELTDCLTARLSAPGADLRRDLAEVRTGCPLFYEYSSGKCAYVDLESLLSGLEMQAASSTDRASTDFGRQIGAIKDRISAGLKNAALKHCDNFHQVDPGFATSILLLPLSSSEAEIYQDKIAPEYSELDFNKETGWSGFLNSL